MRTPWCIVLVGLLIAGFAADGATAAKPGWRDCGTLQQHPRGLPASVVFVADRIHARKTSCRRARQVIRRFYEGGVITEGGHVVVLGYRCVITGDPGAPPIIGRCVNRKAASHRVVWSFNDIGAN